MGKQHTEYDVLQSLMKKRIFFTHQGIRHPLYGSLRYKTVVISDSSDSPGIKMLGKLDYLRGQGWTIIDLRTTEAGTSDEETKQEQKRLHREAKKQQIKITTFKKD